VEPLGEDQRHTRLEPEGGKEGVPGTALGTGETEARGSQAALQHVFSWELVPEGHWSG